VKRLLRVVVLWADRLTTAGTRRRRRIAGRGRCLGHDAIAMAGPASTPDQTAELDQRR
jgi:hypothetical protein